MASAEQNMHMGQMVRQAYGYAGEAVDQPATLRELLAALTNVSFLPANSASQTVIIMGKLATDPNISIFLKIFDGFLPHFVEGKGTPPYETLNLRAEYLIYSELYKLRHLGLTPNVLSRVGTYRITTTRRISTFLEDPALKAIKNYDNYFYTGLKGTHPRLFKLPQIKNWGMTMCIMSCTVEYSLFDCLNFVGDKAPLLEDLVGMLYQIMHLLTWFEHIQMTHHDLHAGNIRVEYHAEPIDLYYQHREGRCVHVRTKYVIKLYDFDRSTIYKQTDLGGGMVVQPVYNYDTGFGVFNAKEDAFKILIMVLGNTHDLLLIKLIPGLDPRVGSMDKIGDLYKNLPPTEKPLYEAIMNNTKCLDDADYVAEKQLVLASTFTEYFNSLDEQQIITIPANNNFALCSIYLPNSIMLPHLDILDVLSAASAVSVEEAQASGQPVYSTPNIRYAPPPPPAPRAAKMGRKRESENENENDDGEGYSKRQRTASAVPVQKKSSSWFNWIIPAIPTILPAWWWKRETNRSNRLDRIQETEDDDDEYEYPMI